MFEAKLPPKCFKSPILVENLENKKPRTNMTCEAAGEMCHYLSTSPIDQGFSLPCRCGLSSKGHAYCPQLHSKGYTENMAKVIEQFGMKCHTLERHDIYKCYQRHAKSLYYSVLNDEA